MADGMGSTDQEKRVKQLKRELEGWREVIIPLNSVLLWEKNWYPGMLVGLSTVVFFFLWYLDPSVLTTVSVLGLITTLVDYLVPTLTASICHPDSWTGIKERKLEEICRSLVSAQMQLLFYWALFYDMRQTRPRVYYTSVVSTLICLAWLGNLINNLLLTYLLFTTSLLIPGLKHHGMLQKYVKKFWYTASEVTKGFKQKTN